MTETSPLAVARDDALAYAASMRGVGYDADVWQYDVTLNADIGHRATGYAIEHGPDFGAPRLPYGMAILCQPGQLALDTLIRDGRALTWFREAATNLPPKLHAWCLAGYNPRETGRQRDQQYNPGTLPIAYMRPMQASAMDDGPATFYNFRLSRVTLAGLRVDDNGNTLPEFPMIRMQRPR